MASKKLNKEINVNKNQLNIEDYMNYIDGKTIYTWDRNTIMDQFTISVDIDSDINNLQMARPISDILMIFETNDPKQNYRHMGQLPEPLTINTILYNIVHFINHPKSEGEQYGLKVGKLIKVFLIPIEYRNKVTKSI